MKRFYPESEFGGFTDVSGTVRFYVRVQSLLEPNFTVLDIGCGRGSYAEDLTGFQKKLQVIKGQVKRVIGIDVDAAGATNPCLDEFRLIERDSTWPIETASIDLAISDWTMEHVTDPEAFLRECNRVLVPGGYLCMRTANRLGYIALISSLVPNKFHEKVLGKAQPSREAKDVFPTVYRCNTIAKLRRALQRLNFKCSIYAHEAEPSYLSFSLISYALGVAYQKIVPSFLGSSIYVFARKDKN